MKKYLILSSLLFIVPLNSDAQTAREIMNKVDAVARSSTQSSFIIMTLSTCQYAQNNKKIRCIKKARNKKLETVQINTGVDNKDSQSISIILEPSSDRGIGMLTYTYDDAKKDTQSWLYLSALGKVKRMASGNAEDAEPTALFGSEFTTEDMETSKLDEYTYQILKEGTYSKRPVWLLEIIPNANRLKKSRYSKTIIWVDKERYTVMKNLTYDKQGKPYKRFTASQFEQINAIWLARSVVIMNLQTHRLSKIKTLKIAMNIAVDKEFLTKRTLTDFAFRENILDQLRKQLK